jgi:hypothetical protein
MLYGWRALVACALVLLGCAAGMLIWRRVGHRGQEVRLPQGLWLALLLAMTLPAHLAVDALPGTAPGAMVWLVLPGAGLLLAALMWLLGGLSVHPVLASYLLLVSILGSLMTPHWVLFSDRLLVGDLSRVWTEPITPGATDGWAQLRSDGASDAMFVRQTASAVLNWSPALGAAGRTRVTLDDLPPLEDLVVGGHPVPIGCGSAVAVIVGGLFLIYRGLTDARIPVVTVLSMAAGLAILPLPYALGESPLRWYPLLAAGADAATAITFVNYQLMASPALFMALFLATSPAVRPMARRARVLFAVVLGLMTAACQLYLSVAHGPYIALLATSLLTPLLDRWWRPSALI